MIGKKRIKYVFYGNNRIRVVFRIELWRYIMKAKFSLILSIISILLIAVGLNYASSIKAKCNDCITDSACSGIRAWGNNGAPIGCQEKVIGTDCKGTCTECRNGASSNYCEWTGDGDDLCISDTQAWTDCGDEYELDCTGGPFPKCSCTGTASYQDDDCNLHFCEE